MNAENLIAPVGKTELIIGGRSGIGPGIGRSLVRASSRVAFTGRRETELAATGVRVNAIEPWADRLKVLSRLPNVCCKISGLTTEADWRGWTVGQLRPYIEIALEAFGNDRVMFGSDWPVSTPATGYARWIEAVMEFASSIPGTDSERLFSANAEAFYGV